MVESPVFYMSYRSSLERLRSKTELTLPFVEELVGMKPSSPPDYISPDTEVGWSVIAEDTPYSFMSEMEEVLASDTVKLDSSQKDAIRHVFSNKVAVVQGPPGTGKSYINGIIIQLLLSLSTLPPGPILVMTYKNKALDATLKACLKFTSEVVRVGGGCQDQALDAYQLQKLFFASLWDHENYKALKLHRARHLRKQNLQELAQIRTNTQEYTRALESLAKTGKGEHILSLQSFVSEASLPQVLSIITNSEDRERVKELAGGDIRESFARWKRDDEASKEIREILRDHYVKWMPDRDVIEGLLETDNDFKPVIPESNGQENEDIMEEAAIDTEKIRTTGIDKDVEDWNAQTRENTFAHSRYFIAGNRYLDHNASLQKSNLSNLRSRERAIFLLATLARARRRIQMGFTTCMQEYQRVCADLQDTVDGLKLQILRRARVVGFTVTGGAMFAKLIGALRPPIIIVEEAGEVLESHMIAVLPSTVRHFIQIGDHKQLRPMCNFVLAKNNKFDVSLMERLINNKSPHATLSSQSRMRTEFVPLIKQFYPHLASNPAVNERQWPACMKFSMFLWDHSALDKLGADGAITNFAEADMCTALASWLVSNSEHGGRDIAILALYKAQVNLIKAKVAQLINDEELLPTLREGLAHIFIGTVDNFQGAENRTVILSVTRNNQEKKFGFCGVPNRVCVALSRAQSGLYIVGAAMFLCRSVTWSPVVEYMRKQHRCAKDIPIHCPRHPKKAVAMSSQHMARFQADRVCTIVCNGKREESNACNHPCAALCHSGPHPICQERIEYEFPCGHVTSLICGLPHNLALCPRCPDSATQPRSSDVYLRDKLQCLQRGHWGKVHYQEVHPGVEYSKISKVAISNMGLPGRCFQIEVIRIQKIVNQLLMEAWYRKRLSLRSTEFDWWCKISGQSGRHRDIVQLGFKDEFEQRDSFGKGIYLSSKQTEDEEGDMDSEPEERTGGIRQVLLCKVLFGTRKESKERGFPHMNAKIARELKIDSIHYNGEGMAESVVYDHTLILPVYLIEVRTTTATHVYNQMHELCKFGYRTRAIQPPRGSVGLDNEMHFRVAQSSLLASLAPDIAHACEVQLVTLVLNHSLASLYASMKQKLEEKCGTPSDVALAVYTHNRNPREVAKKGVNTSELHFPTKFSPLSLSADVSHVALLCLILLGNKYPKTTLFNFDFLLLLLSIRVMKMEQCHLMYL